MSQSKIAVITGAGRGLGRNTALKLAADGVGVVITYRSSSTDAEAAAAEAQAAGVTAVALELDVDQVGTFPAFVDTLRAALQRQWGREDFDFLVNNAGIGIAAPFAETTEAQFDALFSTHVKGVFFLTQALLPLIADGGAIVNISSGLTRFVGAGQSAYATAKGAVEVLTRYLAKELGPRGIRVNAVAPGATGTDFGGGALRDNDQVRGYLSQVTALGRVGEPDDIGGAIVSLLSDGSRWITAQRIEASGGMNL